MKHSRHRRALRRRFGASRRRFGHAGAYVHEFEHGGRRVVIARDEMAGSYEARVYAFGIRPRPRVVKTITGKTANAVESKAKTAIDEGDV